MYYPISIGLDVHLNSISACAFNTDSGEITERKFAGDDHNALGAWVASLDAPAQAVYESGFCGFTLKRFFEEKGIPCKIAATSKLAKPSGDKVKTDRRDAAFLARQLAVGNITDVHVPTIDREGMRDLSRALGIVRSNLVSAKLRVTQSHHRYGLGYRGEKATGTWTSPWLSWAKSLKMPSAGAQQAYDGHVTEALELIDEKKRIAKLVSDWCDDPQVKYKADALMAIKGISKTVAFALAAEIGEFSRFSKGSGFSSFLGLVPSENSSGNTVRKGNITRTGNEHVRKSLIESAWCHTRMKTPYKKAPDGLSPEICAIARKASTRLLDRTRHLRQSKKPCVANAAAYNTKRNVRVPLAFVIRY
jgi:transposase